MSRERFGIDGERVRVIRRDRGVNRFQVLFWKREELGNDVTRIDKGGGGGIQQDCCFKKRDFQQKRS